MYHICSNRSLVSNRSLSRLEVGVGKLINTIRGVLTLWALGQCSPAVKGLDPKVPVKVFFSLDYLSMRSNESFQGGCETLTPEHSEKSKMAAKIDAETKNHHNFTSIQAMLKNKTWK